MLFSLSLSIYPLSLIIYDDVTHVIMEERNGGQTAIWLTGRRHQLSYFSDEIRRVHCSQLPRGKSNHNNKRTILLLPATAVYRQTNNIYNEKNLPAHQLITIRTQNRKWGVSQTPKSSWRTHDIWRNGPAICGDGDRASCSCRIDGRPGCPADRDPHAGRNIPQTFPNRQTGSRDYLLYNSCPSAVVVAGPARCAGRRTCCWRRLGTCSRNPSGTTVGTGKIYFY